MGFKKFVEVGRVALVNYGEDYGKICVIVDIIGPTSVLIDGPKLGVARQVINLRRLSLTPIVIKITKGARTGYLKEAIEKQKLVEQWNASPAGQKLKKKEVRAKLTDFERFEAMVLQRKRSSMVKKLVAKK
jgi:large subunit ribosomal protein L14e